MPEQQPRNRCTGNAINAWWGRELRKDQMGNIEPDSKKPGTLTLKSTKQICTQPRESEEYYWLDLILFAGIK